MDIHYAMTGELLKTKSELNLKNLHILRGDIKNLPVRENTIDFICFILVLHHIPDPFSVIGNVLQRMKKKGFLVIIDFIRHRQKELADEMHDIWLGFNPEVFKRIAGSIADLLFEDVFGKNPHMRMFYQVWQKV